MLWKAVFYKHIEEFRKNLKKLQTSTKHPSSESTSTQLQSSPSNSHHHQQQQQQQHDKLAASFRTFLNSSSEFYQRLYLKLLEKRNFIPVNSPVYNAFTISIHKTFIILGDLARYKELYETNNNNNKEKDWSNARSYYLKAIEINSFFGNPQNQLAVVATYQEDEFEAIYRYFRSLAVLKPFISARDNLTLLFEKNRQKMMEISKQNNNNNNSNNSSSQSNHRQKRKRNPPASPDHILQDFFVKYVRLQGILFTKTSLETFQKTLQQAMKDLKSLLLSSSLIEEIIALKIVAMAIFSIENIDAFTPKPTFDSQETQLSTSSSSSSTPPLSESEAAQRFVLRNHAIAMCCAVLAVFAQGIASNSSSLLHLLGAFNTLLEWILVKYDTISDPKYEDALVERNKMWSKLAFLMNSQKIKSAKDKIDSLRKVAAQTESSSSSSSKASTPSLLEESELSGFICTNYASLAKNLNSDFCETPSFAKMSREDRALLLRTNKLVFLVEKVLLVKKDSPLACDSKTKKFRNLRPNPSKIASSKKPRTENGEMDDDDEDDDEEEEEEDFEHKEDEEFGTDEEMTIPKPIQPPPAPSQQQQPRHQPQIQPKSQAIPKTTKFQNQPKKIPPPNIQQKKQQQEEELEDEEIIVWQNENNHNHNQQQQPPQQESTKKSELIERPFSLSSSSTFELSPLSSSSSNSSEIVAPSSAIAPQVEFSSSGLFLIGATSMQQQPPQIQHQNSFFDPWNQQNSFISPSNSNNNNSRVIDRPFQSPSSSQPIFFNNFSSSNVWGNFQQPQFQPQQQQQQQQQQHNPFQRTKNPFI